MKRFRSEQYGFELEVPADWSCPRFAFLDKLFDEKRRELIFKSRFAYFLNIRIVPFTSASKLEYLSKISTNIRLKNIKDSFLAYALSAGHKNIDTSSIMVNGEEHFCATYLMGKNASLQTSVGLKMTKSVMHAYPGIYSSLEELIEYSYRHDSGPVIKRYCLAFPFQEKRYDILCALVFGTALEAINPPYNYKIKEYDDVVSTFSLI